TRERLEGAVFCPGARCSAVPCGGVGCCGGYGFAALAMTDTEDGFTPLAVTGIFGGVAMRCVVIAIILSILPKGAVAQMTDANVFTDPQTKTQMLEAYFHRLSAPKPPVFKSRRQWDARRAAVRRWVLQDLGLDPLPERVPLNAQVVAAKDYKDYRLERVWFQTLPNVWASGWLYLPQLHNTRLPAILNPHGHWENGARHPVVQTRCIGLAKKGYVAFAVDSMHVTHWGIGVCSAGIMTWNNMRALDYLETRPEVDKTKIGCTGASGGGQQTMYLMATDDRVQVAVPTVLISYFKRILFPTEQTH
ncbi:MAG: hypothetical protein RMK49_02600, partial [Abditibacteriales bacterium]|nr:hypothetical protein [Abditibacteriales bacterium]